MNHLIIVFETFDGGRCPVGRMVVDHDDIKIKGCLLTKHTLNGICNRFLSITNGYNHRSLQAEGLFVKLDILYFIRSEISTHGLEMFRTDLFHLKLYRPLGRVDVVKLLFATLSQITFFFRIKQFVEMEQCSLTLTKQAQVI